ncbi:MULTISPECIES: hypothetical protein [Streptomyces]|uniref:hypothetical protein n=1 Tax=Streptomyces TaxID=1883 RepID=UPI000699910A|nr:MULTISPECIES: hypothetical protein [Streptomyces]MYU50872.1 hypothetical protein [Streptomyces sp. SID7805]
MYAAAPRRGAVRAAAPAAPPRPAAGVTARLRTALLRHWREAQRAAARNVPAGTVKRGRA